MIPNFSLWTEGLDPIHRHHWIAINPEESSNNFFADYDLQHRITDKGTRETALDDSRYVIRLQIKWEHTILATTHKEKI